MAAEDGPRIEVRLEQMRQRRKITMAELARRVGITEPNLYALRRGSKKAIRFPTLAMLCQELDCTVGELLVYIPGPPAQQAAPRDSGTTETGEQQLEQYIEAIG
ncbi:helix-turn-helix domain-containing protein [Nocardia altamirensis]|uniref:helix-turn-helix domain-containing protein n=1 Tax=Nocardia altamirensis TaxID=472158 RepID=UPI000840481B|nr:helix-turn-helix transcriptional regulator [Nocardia altamirensis]